MTHKNILRIIILLGLSLVACTPSVKPAETQTLTIMTHDSFAVSEALVTQFEQEHNARLNFIKAGDTGAALNRVILLQLNDVGQLQTSQFAFPTKISRSKILWRSSKN